jgi:hypothetical protein
VGTAFLRTLGAVATNAAAVERLGLLVLTLTAFAVRFAVLRLTVDVPGDGPTRAGFAYDWAQAPRWETHGAWLPGFMYLAGVFAWLVPSMATPRFLNATLGALTVPLFWALIARIHGRPSAWFAAVVLVLVPLHVGLSASSLTEVSFAFEMIAAMVFLLVATRVSGHPVYAALWVAALGLAAMTRYEAWVLMPLFPIYYFLKTRKLLPTLAMTATLLAFPIIWSFGNYVHLGSPFAGFSAAVDLTETTARGLSVVEAVRRIGVIAAVQFGWVIVAAVVVGVMLQIWQSARRLLSDETFYLAVFTIYWLAMFRFMMVRGEALWVRYLLLGLVLSLPFAAITFVRLAGRRRYALAVMLAVSIAVFGVSAWRYRAVRYVTREQPAQVTALSIWLNRSPYHDKTIVLTKMEWQSTYLYFSSPQTFSRSIIFSSFTGEAGFREWIESQRPTLLITTEDDAGYQPRLERALGVRISDRQIVYEDPHFTAYDLGLEP